MLDAVMQNFCEWRKRPFSPLVKREKICYNRQSIPDYRKELIRMEFLTKLLGIATAVAETTTGAADPAAVTTDSAAGGIVGILFSLLPLLLVFVLMYFMMIRPEKKRRKKEQDMLASLKKGDRVCTIGGIYATIESIRDDTITLSVGKGDQTMVVARWAIRSVEDVTIENETESLN